jgi:hypothetical protein
VDLEGGEEMSSTLKWEPIIDRGKSLSDDLKFRLRKKYGGTIDNIILNQADVAYLEGLRDGMEEHQAKEIQGLLDAIEKYGDIRLWKEF